MQRAYARSRETICLQQPTKKPLTTSKQQQPANKYGDQVIELETLVWQSAPQQHDRTDGDGNNGTKHCSSRNTRIYHTSWDQSYETFLYSHLNRYRMEKRRRIYTIM